MTLAASVRQAMVLTRFPVCSFCSDQIDQVFQWASLEVPDILLPDIGKELILDPMWKSLHEVLVFCLRNVWVWVAQTQVGSKHRSSHVSQGSHGIGQSH